MSRRWLVADVRTLNPIVEPRFTLMSVAKPWMAELPEPVMSHWLRAVPGLVFSQAISLTTGTSQGAAAACGAGVATSADTARAREAATAVARRRPCGHVAVAYLPTPSPSLGT